MRKSIFIALVSLFLAVLLISCDSKNQDDPTPSQPNQSGQTDKSSLPRLSVLVDLPSAGSGSVDDFFSYVPGNGKSFLIITETLPPEGQERSAALTRIRTEILAGKAPMSLSAPAGSPDSVRKGFSSSRTRPWKTGYSCRWTTIFLGPSTWSGTVFCRL